MKNTRGWMIWGALALCAAMVLGAMGWLSHRVLSADRERREAEAKAELEERTRLALWRMDAEGSSILLSENRIPPRDYWKPDAIRTGEDSYVIPPHAVMVAGNPLVHLHFEAIGDRSLVSPEAASFPQSDPEVTARIAASQEKLGHLKTILSSHPLPLENGELLRCAVEESESSWSAMPKEAVLEKSQNLSQRADQGWQARQTSGYQFNFNEVERAQRAKAVEQTLSYSNSMESPSRELSPTTAALPQPMEPATVTSVGSMRSAWIGGELFLLRQVNAKDAAAADLMIVQGAWLDEALLRETLLKEIRDLLPAATLAAVPGAADLATASPGDPLALVSFPFKLVRNESPAVETAGIGAPLATGWLAVLLALAAMALLVRGILQLSERRASFVSAVTHELRTPLTTFQLYSDMLQSGAVKEEKRGDYFRTLHREADRLSHLVENVLAFSRIERGSARATSVEQAAAQLIGPMIPRFAERLESAGLTLRADLSGAPWQTLVKADPAAVEHVLFNLIDNAAKYAAAASPPEVVLEATPAGRFIEIRVRDHGPGITPAEHKRVFRAFHKSAAAAAESRPGVGLGLALSRRLARAGGGELSLSPDSPGACFVLTLPLVA